MGADLAGQFEAYRYHASLYGRFTSPDPDGASERRSDPGSWNRYAYVSSDPVNRNDPSGLNEFFAGGDDGDYGVCVDDGVCGFGISSDSGIPNICLTNPTFALAHAEACGLAPGAMPPTAPVPPPPTCGQTLGIQSGGAWALSASSLSTADLLGVTSFFEDEAAVPTGGSLSSTMSSIWSGIDWTFENRANLSPSQAALFYGSKNIPGTFQGVVAGTSRSQGSQVWNASTDTLKSNFNGQLNGILNGSSTSSLCNGLDDALAIAVGVTSGYLADPVGGALQFASGGVVPGHGAGVVENPVVSFGTFTFYQPIFGAK